MSAYNLNGNNITNAFDTVFIAASNSNTADKIKANYICSGVNDETTIQAAIDSLTDGGCVYLATGDYYLDGWSYDSGGYKDAICVKNGTQREIRISGMTFPMRKTNSHDILGTAHLHLTATAISSLSGTESRVSVIGYGGSSRVYPGYVLNVRNMAITLADNQHAITAIDGKFFSAMFAENIFFNIETTTYSGTDDGNDYTYPVEACVALRGLDGSNFGAGYRVSNCFAWGYGTAYLFNGEHLIAEQLGCRFCNFSYKFGDGNTAGADCHDLTLLNCCHEFCSRFPAFFNYRSGQANKKQAINFYDYNVEDSSEGQFATVALATEEADNSYCGRVYYTVTSASTWNNIDKPFFADGSGSRFIVVNTAYPS